MTLQQSGEPIQGQSSSLQGRLALRCAWCGLRMGHKPSQTRGGVSHGICDACYQRLVWPFAKP